MNQGYNEESHSVTAEVRVADIVDPTDIDIYRQLAGGLTVAHVLHGSANTIGGQSQLIKLRWGSDAQGLAFEGATPTIKFALGENVKGSNWGPGTRYPATRMGVEQVLRDAFAGAREYAREQRAWRADPRRGPEPRRDLQLEALTEVLDGKRLVHIHSYRADEILMFARLAKELGIPVAAFQHVLEGYKVADAIAAIGAGGSTFSDWWGYKMEVQDAIPGNAALMHRAGVLVSVNSDDAELGRRLNTEAAKAMKYGGLSEREALALVTINPARQLRIEQRTGSLEPGKDADFVIWSGPPLSNYSRAEQTWIDGRRYFDVDSDRSLRAAAASARRRLVSLALRAPPSPPGDAPRPTDAAGEARPVIAAHDLGQTPWRHLLDRARVLRPAYAGLAPWHECTEHAP
jgi:imidazolonepropionase-like amidohydrolase